VIASISNIGFIGFFVFMLSMGIALLWHRSQPDEATQVSTQSPNQSSPQDTRLSGPIPNTRKYIGHFR
jgi:hypothetical protein